MVGRKRGTTDRGGTDTVPSRLILNNTIADMLLVAPLIFVPIFGIVALNNLCTLPDNQVPSMCVPDWLRDMRVSICGHVTAGTGFFSVIPSMMVHARDVLRRIVVTTTR